MILQPELKPLVEELAKKHNMTQEEVIKICDSQFMYLRELISKGDKEDFNSFPSFRLAYLGAFVASPGKYYYINKNKQLKDAKQSNQELQA